jgi:hypothetical protein
MLNKKGMQNLLLAGIALLLLLPNLFKEDVNIILPYDQKEKFDPALSRINSISLLTTYTDSIASSKKIAAGSYEYVELLEAVLEERFYHGFSHYTPDKNWIAAYAGKFIKHDYACKVQPEEILQHSNAACSQQSLVMMAVLREKNLNYRSLGFPNHYAMEVLINKEWYFYDANMEPGITKQQRMLSSWQHRSDNLKQYYDKNHHANLDFQFGNNLIATTGTINELPAQKATYFHIVTGIFSKIAFLFPLIFIFPIRSFRRDTPFVSLLIKKRKPLLSLSA